MERDRFLENPSEAMRLAETHGTITVTNPDGSVYSVLSVPNDDVCPDANEALALAEEITREEPYLCTGWHQFCPVCQSDVGTPDGQHFVHEPDCKWQRLRDYFAAAAKREKGAAG